MLYKIARKGVFLKSIEETKPDKIESRSKQVHEALETSSLKTR